MENRVAIQSSCNIPCYHMYKGNVPQEFTLRAMTTLEEKKRLAKPSLDTLASIIDDCIVEPNGIKTKDLTMMDMMYLMYQLRIVTYGADYKVSLKCPHCGKKINLTINLDELEVNEATEDSSTIFELPPLPNSGDVLECKVLTASDTIEIDKEAEKILNKYPDYVGDPKYILDFVYKIVSINGEKLPTFKVQNYVESLTARDSAFISSKYNKYVNGIGMNILVSKDCTECGEGIEFGLPMTSEFFRPTFDD